MIGKIIGALFGAEVERGRGGSGLKGAAIGTIAAAVIRRLGPIGLLLGGAYVAKKALDRRADAKDETPPAS